MLILALVTASAISFLYLKVASPLLPVPRKTAVLITGCSSGIGRDCALRLSSLGFFVFAGVRRESDATALKSEAVQMKGSSASLLCPIILDVTKGEHINAATGTVSKRLNQEGRALIAVINNAGYAEESPMEVIPIQALRQQFETILVGSIAVSQAFLPLLRNGASTLSQSYTGRLLFVSSITGCFSIPGLGAYCSSKFSLEALGDAWRMELRKWRINVCLIEPGQLDTQLDATSRKTAQASRNKIQELPPERSIDASVLASYQRASHRFFHLLLPAESASYATDAVVCALLAARPLARYRAGWTSLPTSIFNLLPVAVADAVMGYAYR